MRPYSFKHVLPLLFVATLFLSACSTTDAPAESSIEINTLNLYFAPTTLNGDDVIGIYSFNPDNGLSTLRDTHLEEENPGEVKALTLDTDRDKQGYEYFAYVKDDEFQKNAVYLLNYDKDTNGKITKLWAFEGKVCSLSPRLATTESIISDKDLNATRLINQQTIDISTSDLNTCDPETDNRFELSFDFEAVFIAEQITLKQTNFASRATIIDFNHIDRSNIQSDGSGEIIRGRHGELGDDRNGNISLLASDGSTVWSTPLPDAASTFYAFQVNNTDVLLQIADKLYSLPSATLFDAASIDLDTNAPTTSLLDSLFDTFKLTLIDADLTKPITIQQNDTTLVIQDGKKLLYLNDGEFEEAYSFADKPEIIEISFHLTTRNTILVEQIHDSFSTLVSLIRAADNTWQTSSSPFGSNQADEFQVYVDNNDTYITSLNLGTFGNSAGWEAHLSSFNSDNNQVFTQSYTNSIFLLPEESDTKNRSLFLLSSEPDTAPYPLIDPKIYRFDSSRANGRELLTDQDGSITVDENSLAQAEVLAQLPSNIYHAPSYAHQINDESVFFSLPQSGAEESIYFFDPSREIFGE